MAEMNQSIDDRAFMLHILSNLGDDYELVQFHLDHRMFSFTNPLTIEELRTELSNRYDKIKYKYSLNQTPENPSQYQPRSQGQDRALYAGGKFKGTCNKCGKIGHRAVDCCSGGRGNQNQNQ
jgi:Zinc knuckle